MNIHHEDDQYKVMTVQKTGGKFRHTGGKETIAIDKINGTRLELDSLPDFIKQKLP